VNPVLKLFVFAQAHAADAVAALRKREEGQTMAEYGVVLAVITLAVIVAISLLSERVKGAFTSVANILPGG
jgi:Flp pilus assembly pilin Flp